MSQRAILVGAFQEMIELCENCNVEIIGIIDNTSRNSYRGYKILGDDSLAPSIRKNYPNISIILTPDLPHARRKLADIYSQNDFEFLTLISPRSTISKSVKIGKGVVIQSGVNISADVVIGDFVKLNTLSNIMHDTQVGRFSTIAPNAVVLGKIKIGEGCYIGTNATILPKVNIGKGTIVGAGAVVLNDLAECCIYAGNPAKKIREFKDYYEEVN